MNIPVRGVCIRRVFVATVESLTDFSDIWVTKTRARIPNPDSRTKMSTTIYVHRRGFLTNAMAVSCGGDDISFSAARVCKVSLEDVKARFEVVV